MELIKILIVEDEPVLALDLATKLQKLGYEVIDVVARGELAINLVKQTQPDLIFMDIRLKGTMDGIETATQILQIEDIPIVYLTGLADEDTVERAEKTGCYGYMLKPCQEIELYATTKIVLKKHKELAKAKISQVDRPLKAFSNQSNYNSVTHLPNRLLLQTQFNQALQQWDKNIGITSFQGAAIVYLNIDRFNRVNNNLGHKYGNWLLIQIAQRLQTVLNDRVLVSHLNADEFALVFFSLDNRQEIITHIEPLSELFNQSFILNQREIFLTASMGIAFYPWDGTQIEQLLQKAHQAMRQAKQLGGNQYQFYQSTFAEKDADILTLETDLRYALGRKELQLYYQPIVCLNTGRIVGAETLIRWHHPYQGIISPRVFIPVAEQIGLINMIGEWVLFKACQQMKIWQSLNSTIERIAVNLSGRQFNQANLGQTLINILKTTQLDSRCLDLELTESILIANSELTIHQLNTLKSLGIKISVDDFGTGYSSFSYLQKFPFDILKIDRCFVQNIDKNSKNKAITRALIQMAHQLNLKVIAEGVETEAELTFLLHNRCDEIQGFLCSPPLPGAEFEQLIANSNQLANLAQKIGRLR